ncbi:MAG TPA: STAS domain-containing protein [Roseiflexaceae bacterium]|nr:STAS domain-containing protein [Roseiflexaceae bacterium]
MNTALPPHYKQIIADHPFPWAIYGVDGFMVGYNSLCEEVFGVSLESWVGEYNITTNEGAKASGYQSAFLQAVQGQRVRLPAQKYPSSKGDVWYEGEVFPNHDDQGTIIAVSLVLMDVTTQKVVEADLLHRTEEIILAQQATLRELSTPLIPLADAVVVMPLVGSIDSQRAQLIMETLLEGISTHQSDVAILDITGVPVVDTQVADALLRTARAARLLGAQVVLTGIGSHIAQTLITVGADLSGIVTLNNLQSGIAYALRVVNPNSAALGLMQE